MASGCDQILVHCYAGQSSVEGRCGRLPIAFGTWMVPIALLFTTSLAGGQAIGDLSKGRSGGLFGHSISESSVVPIESAISELPASIEWQLSYAQKYLADQAVQRKWVPILYIIVVFFITPLFLIFVSR